MIREVTCLLSLLVALAASGCSVGTESSDDVIETSDEQSLTHVLEGTDQNASRSPASQVRENIGYVNARSIGEGPQPDPWAPVVDTTPNPAGPQPDPWKQANHRVVPTTGNGTIAPDKH